MEFLKFITIISLFSSFSCLEFPSSDKSKLPIFVFSWCGDKDTFCAGETAAIKVKVLERADMIGKKGFKPVVSFNGIEGNSSYVSTLFWSFENEPSNYWKIYFTPIKVGVFNVLIKEDSYQVYDSSLHFQVEPGNMYSSMCVVSWKGMKHEFEAGAKATIMVLLKDAFGNSIFNNNRTSQVFYLPDFKLSVLHENNGSIASVPDISNIGWNEFDYIIIEFVVTKSGRFSLSIEGGNQTLNGSPLPLKVNSGPVDVSSCVAKWNIDSHAWQLSSKMEIFIHQLDQYGNLVSGLYPFDAEVVERDTNLSIPISDQHFEEVDAGIQLFSFGNWEQGKFLLTLYNAKHNKSISNMPYAYSVFVGYCDGEKSVVNGSGLNDSVAGIKQEFSVYLNDVYEYPSPVEADVVQVQILKENDSYSVSPFIYPILNKNGSISISRLQQHGLINQMDLNNRSESSIVVSAFHVEYTPEKSGFYNIHVYCGNVLLNKGHSLRKEVQAGEVNVSLSSVVEFSSKVAKMSENEVLVQLMDSFSNPVPAQQSRLKLKTTSANRSLFQALDIKDNKDGSYNCSYMAKDIGTYEICASFDANKILPCPLSINVYSSEYFPKAKNDTVSVWEDQSIAIDVLANDYFPGDNATIIQFTKPEHGSILHNGRMFRYTPYKYYYGNDSFSYTISDVNESLANAYVNISVLNVPPQIASVPSKLQATEDLICPRFGGFSGFEITYSNPIENISVNLSAKFGSILLSPMVMQFGQEMWNELLINSGNETARSLQLQGTVEVINFALQSIQYLGNENFYGGDTIQVSAKNKNGMNSLGVPIFIDPINDPPYIRVPYFIVLKSNNEDETLIFDKEKDKFNFSIGDPDLPNFPGGQDNFMLTFSMEVNDGLLVTNLPSGLINTTEVKHKNSYQWQPLQTYVTISKHFMVKATGIRFQGTVKDCNGVMEQLFLHGGEHGAVLTLTLNDMGNHGCYPNCAEGMSSMPLYTEATVILMRKQLMSPFLAHTLGSIIVIEFVVMFSLGLLLLYFTCKCAILLLHERRNHHKSSSEQSTDQITSMNVTENTTYFIGCCSRSSNFRQRFSRGRFWIGESSSKAADQSSPSTIEIHTQPQTHNI